MSKFHRMGRRGLRDRLTDFYTTGLGARVVDSPAITLFIALSSWLSSIVLWVLARSEPAPAVMFPLVLLIFLAPFGGVFWVCLRSNAPLRRLAFFVWWTALAILVLMTSWLTLGTAWATIPLCASTAACMFTLYGKERWSEREVPKVANDGNDGAQER